MVAILFYIVTLLFWKKVLYILKLLTIVEEFILLFEKKNIIFDF